LTIGFLGFRNLINPPGNRQQSLLGKVSQEIEPAIRVSLTLDFGEGNVKTFENIKLKETTTVFDLLEQVTKEKNLEFSYKNYLDLGVFIESIDNVKNDSKTNKWWQYWVNGELAQVGADNYQLKNRDTVEWKYAEVKF
jgi:hypothetical protein